MTSRPRTPPRHVVRVDRVQVTGVPASQLDTVAVAVAVRTALARRLASGRLPARSTRVPTVQVTWSAAAGEQALGEALADGIGAALGTVSRE